MNTPVTHTTLLRERSRNVNKTPQFERTTQITESRWQLGVASGKEASNSVVQVTPTNGDEDDDTTALAVSRDGNDLRASPSWVLLQLDRMKQLFRTIVSSKAVAAVSQPFSAAIQWCLTSPRQFKPQIPRQGRALCLQYIKTQIRRSYLCPEKNILIDRLQRVVETEYGEEAVSNKKSGALAGLQALCVALETKRPTLYQNVASQASQASKVILLSESALASLALVLARHITRENITWSKIAAMYCVCGALAREAAEAALEPTLELVSAPANAIEHLLHEEPGSWIASHGGWNGLAERLRASEGDQKSEKYLQVMVFFFVLICLSLVVFRWFSFV